MRGEGNDNAYGNEEEDAVDNSNGDDGGSRVGRATSLPSPP